MSSSYSPNGISNYQSYQSYQQIQPLSEFKSNSLVSNNNNNNNNNNMAEGIAPAAPFGTTAFGIVASPIKSGNHPPYLFRPNIGESDGIVSPHHNNPNFDTPICMPPSDTVTHIAWSTNNHPNNTFEVSRMACGSWANDLRIWDIRWDRGESIPLHVQREDKPVLSCEFQDPNSIVYASGCVLKTLDISNPLGISTSLSEHLAPIIYVCPMDRWVTISIGWDKLLLLTDQRVHSVTSNITTTTTATATATATATTTVTQPIIKQAQPTTHSRLLISYPSIPHTASNRDKLVSVGLDDKRILTYDLRKPNQPYHEIKSPLSLQTRSLAFLPHPFDGLIIGSVDGKIALVHFQSNVVDTETRPSWFQDPILSDPEKKHRSKQSPLNYNKPTPTQSQNQFQIQPNYQNYQHPSVTSMASVGSMPSKQKSQLIEQDFCFKAHWLTPYDVYAVNKIVVHPYYQSIASVGGDGVYQFWDLYSGKQLFSSKPHQYRNGSSMPITTCSFPPGNPHVFVYALGNDYSKINQHTHDQEKNKTQLLIHTIHNEKDLRCHTMAK